MPHFRRAISTHDGKNLLSSAVAGTAYDVNNNGLIVGRSQFSGRWYNYRAWVGVSGFAEVVDLNDVTDLDGFPYLTDALSANNRDLIVGIGMYNPGSSILHGVVLRSNE